MNEERFDRILREAAREYNASPEPPREAMWARIEAARRAGEGPRRPHGRTEWWRWGAGLAAMLAVGFGVGRLTVRPAPVGPAAIARAQPGTRAADGEDEPGAAGLPYRLAASQHLSETEAFLTSFQVETRGGRSDHELATWARDLLASTRLLLDSPAADDPRIGTLLEDLELVLAQIAQLPTARTTGDVELIDRAIEHHAVLSRLRAAVPAGPAAIGT